MLMFVSDRIEAGTFLLAAAMSGGDVVVRGARAEHLAAVVAKLREAGADLEEGDAWIRVRAGERLRGVDVKTQPHPGFPTDLQAQFMAAMLTGDGRGLPVSSACHGGRVAVDAGVDRHW